MALKGQDRSTLGCRYRIAQCFRILERSRVPHKIRQKHTNERVSCSSYVHHFVNVECRKVLQDEEFAGITPSDDIPLRWVTPFVRPGRRLCVPLGNAHPYEAALGPTFHHEVLEEGEEFHHRLCYALIQEKSQGTCRGIIVRSAFAGESFQISPKIRSKG